MVRAMPNFSVAALVMAHKNVDQLTRLIDRLSHPSVDVFLHLDAKWHLEQSELDKLGSLNGGRVYLTRRVSVEPLTWTSLEAELVLIETAVSSGDYSYVMLLSGQDYPIKPIDQIVLTLSFEHPTPTLDATPWHEGNWVAASFGTTGAFKYGRARVKRAINGRVPVPLANQALRGLNHAAATAASKAKQLVTGSPTRRLRRLGWEPAGGSQWWILPADMAAEALNRSRDRRVAAVFRNVGAPDETFFQSALLNSPYADRVRVNPWDERRQMTRTFTDFDSGPTFTGHPAFLGVDYFEQLVASDALFARKFDVDQDAEILDLIDIKLLDTQ